MKVILLGAQLSLREAHSYEFQRITHIVLSTNPHSFETQFRLREAHSEHEFQRTTHIVLSTNPHSSRDAVPLYGSTLWTWVSAYYSYCSRMQILILLGAQLRYIIGSTFRTVRVINHVDIAFKISFFSRHSTAPLSETALWNWIEPTYYFVIAWKDSVIICGMH